MVSQRKVVDQARESVLFTPSLPLDVQSDFLGFFIFAGAHGSAQMPVAEQEKLRGYVLIRVIFSSWLWRSCRRIPPGFSALRLVQGDDLQVCRTPFLGDSVWPAGGLM